MMLENNPTKTVKWDVVGNCKLCGREFHVLWNNMWLRRRHVGEEVCGSCVRKKAYTDEWRQNNSEAQKRVQGTPEARERMADTLKRVHREDPSIGRRISEGLRAAYKNNPEFRKKISQASTRNWKSLEYQEKVTGHGYHHGYFVHQGSRVYFASSWELMFLVWCSKNVDIVTFERCRDRIGYRKPNGGLAYYHPDFTVIWNNGSRTTFEVKGGMQSLDLVERKRVAADDFYSEDGHNYVILFRQDLKRMRIFRENQLLAEWIDKLKSQKVVVEHAKGKGDKKNTI